MSKILLFITVFAAVLGCVKRPSQSERQLYASDFEASQSSDDLFPGWQPKINHGYELQQGPGRQGVGLSMNLMPGLDAKAVMVSGTLDLSQQPAVRLSYAGHLKTMGLVGESSLFMRVFAGDALIFQDDLKGYALSGDRDWTRLEVSSPMLSGATRVEYGVLVIGAGTVFLDDVSLIMNTNTNTHPMAFEYANEALEKIKQNSLYVMSPEVSQQFIQSLAGAQQPADVHGSIVSLLNQMGDDHAKFIPADILHKSGHGIGQTVVSGVSAGSRNRPESFATPIGVGSIRVPAFKKGRDDEAAYVKAGQQIAQTGSEDAACGWVIDLRNNTGGSMWPMLAVLEPWLNQEVVGYMDMADQSRASWRVKYGSSYLGEQLKQAAHQPAGLSQPQSRKLWENQKIAVLINGDTGSSGEAAAMAFKGQDHVRFFGHKTSGLTTGISQLELSDGSLVRLSMAAFLDRNGQAHPDGLMPDVLADDALNAAYQHLADQPGCGHLETIE